MLRYMVVSKKHVSIRGEPGTDFNLYIYDGARNPITRTVGTSYPDTVAFVTGTSPTYIKINSYSGSGEYRLQYGRPDLVAYNVTPVYVRPGQTFRVGYQINSSFYDDIPVGLGCSIKSPSGREYSDINHDTSVSVSYGTDWYYRYFTVPLDAEDGWYDVWWAIYGKYDPSAHAFEVELESTWWVDDRMFVDGTPPPAPVPDDGVSGWSNDNTPTFTWPVPSDASGIAGYYWKVDNDPEIWTTSNSVTLPPQTDGTHTFYVRAKDNAGNVGNWGSHTFQIDTTQPQAPSISSNTHPNQNKWYNNNNPTFTWDVPSDVSGIAGYSCELNQWPDYTPPETITTTGNTKTYHDLSSGTWYFHIRAKDNAGNWGSPSHYEIKIDLEPPTCSGLDDGVSGWSNDNTPTFTWTGRDNYSGVAGYYWKVDGGAETWTTSTSVTLSPQADGIHTFYVRAKDNAGNLGNWISHTFQIDTRPPNLSNKQQNPPGNIIDPPQPVNIRVTASDAHSGIKSVILSYRTSEDNITWSNWIEITMNQIDANTWEQTIPQQTPIKYVQYKITAYDQLNNYSSLPSNTYYYYEVIPEYPAAMLLMLFISMTILIMLVKRKTKKTKADSIKIYYFFC